MRIAVEGCCHGDLDKIYATIDHIQKIDGKPIDLLICCGDFEAVRNEHDLHCMNVPRKYLDRKDFYKYYSGEKSASVPTLFIGGNHEASNHLWELYYGGYVAPNIYYIGHSGVIRFNGLRIAGLSGIFKKYSFAKAYNEVPPYNEQTIRSSCHTRAFEVFKLFQISGGVVDIMLSHDWPSTITQYANEEEMMELLKYKSHLKDDIDKGELGSPASDKLLHSLKPRYWFSAHLHCKFATIVPHSDEKCKNTKFLALDKCLPNRDFLQILDIDVPEEKQTGFEYDIEWLSVIRATNELLISPYHANAPDYAREILLNPYQILDSLETQKKWIIEQNFDLKVQPTSFTPHAPAYGHLHRELYYDYTATDNPQTVALLNMLQLSNYIARGLPQQVLTSDEKNEEEIDI